MRCLQYICKEEGKNIGNKNTGGWRCNELLVSYPIDDDCIDIIFRQEINKRRYIYIEI